MARTITRARLLQSSTVSVGTQRGKQDASKSMPPPRGGHPRKPPVPRRRVGWSTGPKESENGWPSGHTDFLGRALLSTTTRGLRIAIHIRTAAAGEHDRRTGRRPGLTRVKLSSGQPPRGVCVSGLPAAPLPLDGGADWSGGRRRGSPWGSQGSQPSRLTAASSARPFPSPPGRLNSD